MPPRRDGSTWPGGQPGVLTGRGSSFAAATVLRIGTDAAFTPDAHAIADLAAAQVIPLLTFRCEPEDLPHTIHLLRTAAQQGAGIGLSEARSTIAPDRMSLATAGALALALADLPPMPEDLRNAARQLLHTGHHLARCGPDEVDRIAADLA